MINCALNLLKLTQLANIYVTIQILVQHREKKKRENKHMDTKGEAKVGWTERFRLTIYTLLMLLLCIKQKGASQVVLVVKNLPANAGDIMRCGMDPWDTGRSPAGGHENLLQYSCLDNPMDRGAWRAATIEPQSQTQLKRLSTQQVIGGHRLSYWEPLDERWITRSSLECGGMQWSG